MEPMSMDKALQIAASYDKNKDGILHYKQWYKSDDLVFENDTKHWLDENNDGNISVQELAKGLQQGDVRVNNGFVQMTHSIAQPLPAVSESVRMNLQVKTEVNTK